MHKSGVYYLPIISNPVLLSIQICIFVLLLDIFYDPLLIIEKTDGYMEGDHQWIMMVKKER